MGKYNSDKFKGAKLYAIIYNGAKVTSLLGRVFQTWTLSLVNDVSIPKSTVEIEMHSVEL